MPSHRAVALWDFMSTRQGSFDFCNAGQSCRAYLSKGNRDVEKIAAILNVPRSVGGSTLCARRGDNVLVRCIHAVIRGGNAAAIPAGERSPGAGGIRERRSQYSAGPQWRRDRSGYCVAAAMERAAEGREDHRQRTDGNRESWHWRRGAERTSQAGHQHGRFFQEDLAFGANDCTQSYDGCAGCSVYGTNSSRVSASATPSGQSLS